MIKHKVYICSTGRSFIFYFISTYIIIMLKVVVFLFFEPAKSVQRDVEATCTNF
jgi:hypothetical protein